MSVFCVGSDCSTLRFGLEVPGDVFLNRIRLFSNDAAKWQFGSLLDSRDRYGNVIDWGAVKSNSDLTLSSTGVWAPEPVYLTVKMSTWSTAAQLHDGSLAYEGRASNNLNGDALDDATASMAARVAALPSWAVHMTKTQFRAYAHAQVLGDVTEADGDWLTAATREDPTRFTW
jgi:hypothetical protein